MIPFDNAKLCKKCKHGRKAVQYHCELWVDPVDGNAVFCSDARSASGKCGPSGMKFERRMDIDAIVDQAAIFVTRNGEREYIGKAGDPLPIAKTDKATIYRAEDVNLQEWKRPTQGTDEQSQD